MKRLWRRRLGVANVLPTECKWGSTMEVADCAVNRYVPEMKCVCAITALALVAVSAAASPRPAPNVVLLLTDDLGWQDVTCYDVDAPSPMETPNIDALAKKGVQFWQGYAPAPTCAPTRCAIMSGIHPARAQKTHVVGGHPPTPHHKTAHRMMPPWYSGRMSEDTFTLAKAMQKAGYVTGHCGKWHMAINHNAYPQPEDQGFDWTRSSRGATEPMRPNRLVGFSTRKADDPFRLDENGYAFHQNSEDAMTFVREHKDRPFFLYYATWLVHTPIHTRSKARLRKYCEKLGVALPENPNEWKIEGQSNPFYCAMVEELDYHVGRLMRLLETTDDPRWPGHKLMENTYVIFTSDNGGMEGHPGEVITDNYPLDRGKISIMEGGIRVPLIITGPGIQAGMQSEVLVNGLDFYPTILSLVGAKPARDQLLDGCDLKPLLLNNPVDPDLVRNADGSVRDTMVWHFPNSVALESAIRVGDYKLVKNYEKSLHPPLELYRLYNSEGEKVRRVDIEESKNLVDVMPERARSMHQALMKRLEGMKASYPYNNPHCRFNLPNKQQVPRVVSETREGGKVTLLFESNGAKVVRANLLVTDNGGARYEEWDRLPATVQADGKVTAELLENTTHYVFNLIDENQFLVSYPDLPGQGTVRKENKKYSDYALPVRR